MIEHPPSRINGTVTVRRGSYLDIQTGEQVTLEWVTYLHNGMETILMPKTETSRSRMPEMIRTLPEHSETDVDTHLTTAAS